MSFGGFGLGSGGGQPRYRMPPQGWLIILVFFLLLVAPTNVSLSVFFLAVLGRVGYRTYRKHQVRQARRAPAPAGAQRLGTSATGMPVHLSDRQLAAHGLIVGATGSGKTTSLLSILCHQIEQGRPVVAIDLKGSQSFGDHLAAAGQIAGRRFLAWRPDGPAHWNPLAHGDATELKDKLISAEKFTEPHYQRAAERYLQTAIQVIQAAAPERPVTLARTVGMLDPRTLKSLLPHIPTELAHRVGPYISQLNRDQQSAVSGLQSRLAILSESNVGEYLQPGEQGPELDIDLRRALNPAGGEVVLFSLNSSRYGKLSAQIAAMVIQDLIAVAGDRLSQPNRPLAIVAIDEFSALDADNLLNRARESGISVLLSTQELADLERLADGFRDQVLGNSALLLAHRQNVPDSAELIAKMIGTDTIWKHTHQTQRVPRDPFFGNRRGWATTGVGTARQVEEFRVHPNVIKELGTGQAVLITKIPTSTATPLTVQAWRPNGRVY